MFNVNSFIFGFAFVLGLNYFRRVLKMNKQYEVPGYYSDKVKSIDYVGRKRLKVVLQDGYVFDGMREYIIERYALYRSFGLIEKEIIDNVID